MKRTWIFDTLELKASVSRMDSRVRVAILDDHQNIVDGYVYRLNEFQQIEVVATLSFGEDLERTLAEHSVNVLLLDVSVPTGPNNSNPYPILSVIPRMLQLYPELNILVISMHAERGLIRAVMEAGASGYILKDDQSTARDLGNVVLSVVNGGIYFSEKAHQYYTKAQHPESGGELLTSRQLEVISLCAAYPNDTTSQLARRLAVANSTLRNLLSGAYIRLGVHTRAAAISKARHLGLISPDLPVPP